MTTLNRLRDVLSLTAGDLRIQTVFTQDVRRRSALGAGVEEALRDLGARYIPWDVATGLRFDLAVAASENDQLTDLDAPVLLVPHGAGQQKFYPATSMVSGLNPRRLVIAGRVVPAAIALSHQSHLQRLQEICPPAAPYGVVVGDPALARMRASQFRTDHLRAAFGARDRHVVVVASTFGPDSVLGQLPDLPGRLVAALPADEYQVVVVLHPGIWAAHGPWQVRAWLAGAAAYRVIVIAPHDGWQAALLAASVVISDHGSLAVYATVLDKPVILAGCGSAATVPGTAADELVAGAPRWEPDSDPRAQIDAVIGRRDRTLRDRVAGLLMDPTVDGAQRLRSLMYRLLKLAEPAASAAFGPVTSPHVDLGPVPTWVVGVDVDPDGVRVVRFPDLGFGDPHSGLAHRHLVADIRTADFAQISSASVVVADYRAAGSLRRWSEDARREFDRWPQATILAAEVSPTSCAVSTRDGQLTVLTADAPLDPTILASLAYARLAVAGRIPPQDALHIGGRTISVAAEAG